MISLDGGTIRPKTKQKRTIFVVRLRADSDDDPIRALRWLLKRAKRDFGMTAVSVTEEKSERVMP
jgi:hypothetical protein